MTELDGPLPAGPMPLCGNPMATPPASGIDVALRQQLSNLQGLLGISMMMTERGDEQDILDLATTAVPSLGRCRIEGVYLFDLGWRSTAGAGKRHEVRADVQAQLTALRGDGGMIAIRGLCWSWAFQLRSSEGQFGYLVVSAGEQPPDAELFLLRVLAQQTGIALANARLHARERASAEQLRAANCKLAGTVEALERKTAIHDRLTRAAVVLEGPDGIAAAVHELTGFPVAVEDGHGNLLAWAGPGQPAPLGRTAPGRRERVLAKALREGRPIRSHGRLLAVVQPRPDVVGVLALIDPDTRASEAEQVALEHGATVLAMELARLHSLAETELRLGHDTVAEVLDGTNPEAALARARALGYDLDRPHRVGLVDAHGARIVDDSFFDLVRRAASATVLGTLLLPRDGAVVVLSVTEPVDDSAPWERFRAVIENGLGDRCRVGVSGICNSVTEFPRAYREAQLALRLHDMTGEIDHAVVYDQLGVYQLLAEVQDVTAVERHAMQWIGALLDYDARRTSDLVPTLSRFLECGGNYDATARSLQIGRSTLRYRLRRIREISGHDHADPDTRFNLQLATRGWRTRHALENVSAESAVLPGRAWTPEP